ncbi:MAG: DUF3887 domain-containing protein [Lachnospiraceae bacterium]|nr:DUF3887 domain-containing protein [Lachnospiraceae bacterium]
MKGLFGRNVVLCVLILSIIACGAQPLPEGFDEETIGGVVMVGNYKEGTIQCTIAFDEEMKLVQFNIR